MEKAADRAHAMMAADESTSPLLQALYRLARDQTPEVQEQMFSRAIEAVELSDEQKERLLSEFRTLIARAHTKDLPRLAGGQDGLFALDIAPRILSRSQIKLMAERVLRKVFGSEIPLPVQLDRVISEYDEGIVLSGRDDIEGGRFKDGSPVVLGLSRWSADGAFRELVLQQELLDATDRPSRRRANFTMAHEFFHCIEHLLLGELGGTVLTRRMASLVSFSARMSPGGWFHNAGKKKRLTTNEDWREWQANQFAAELLMPEDAVRQAVVELFEVPTLMATAREDVPQFADEIARTICVDHFGNHTSLVDRFDVNPHCMAVRLLFLKVVIGPGD
jgi:hypothetical protein